MESDEGDKNPATIFIKEDQVTYQLNLKDILYIEAYGNYLKVHTNDKVYVVRDTMQHMTNKLPTDQFVRIHKSFIISLSKIDSISGNRVFVNEQEIPVGEMYKMDLKKKIEK
jgi:DNA-binding LytR/AlgR family response regulator